MSSTVSSADAYNAHLQARIREVEENARETAENRAKSEEARVEKMEKDYTKQLSDMRDGYEKAASSNRENTDEAHEELVKHYQNESDRLKKDMYDRYGRYQTNRMIEEQEKARRSIDQMELSNNTRLREMEKYYDSQAKKAVFAAEDRKEQAIANLLTSQAKENDEYQRQRKILEETTAKERANINEQKVAAVRDYDQEWREKFDAMQFAHDIEHNQTRARMLQERHHLENVSDRAAAEKDLTYNKIIAGINHDNKEERMYNAKVYDQNIKRLEQANEMDKAHDMEGRKEQAERLSAQYQESIDHQTKQADKTFNNYKAFTDHELNTTKAENQKLKTSANPKDMSPAAEETVRRAVSGEYQQRAELQEQKAREDHDALRAEYQGRWLDKDFEKQTTEQRLKRENISALAAHRQDTMNTVRDMEERTRSVIVDESGKMQKREHATLKQHARELEMQRNQIQGQVDETLDQATLDKKAVRSDADYNMRLKEREFNSKYTDMIKAYERHIAELKDEHELELRSKTLDLGKQARDQERQLKAMMDEQERAHKFQLAEAEQSRKERERLLNETYENEVSKLRRHNQMLMKKQS